MSIKCDVLVVGGGPAGSSAARAASIQGAKTILVEKQKIITNVPCAEGIGSYLFPFLPFKIPKDQLIWNINGILFSDGETQIIQKNHFYKAWSINRGKFDNFLLQMAKKNGSKIMMNSELTDLKMFDNKKVNKAYITNDKKQIIIEPEIIIAADGVESTVAKKLGLIKETEDSIGHVVSWEMKNVDNIYPHLEQMFFGNFAPRAYAYVFPKSKNTANIGVGSTKGDENLDKYFEIFTNEIIKNQVKNAVKTINRSGKAPIKKRIDNIRYKNIIFTGDSANQNFKPYEEGILPSIICGDIAGNIAAKKDISRYEKIVNKKFKNQFNQSNKIIKKMYSIDKIDDKKRDLIMMYLYAFMETEEIDKLSKKNVEEIKEILFKKSRHVNSFITMFLYLLWYFKVLATRCD